MASFKARPAELQILRAAARSASAAPAKADPRLVQLVRLLARQAADEYFDAAVAKREDGSPN